MLQQNLLLLVLCFKPKSVSVSTAKVFIDPIILSGGVLITSPC